jgi:hypothetical protein
MKETEDYRKALDTELVVPVWPHAGRLLGLSRGGSFAASQRGDIKTLKIGRLRKVPTSWLKQTLGLA